MQYGVMYARNIQLLHPVRIRLAPPPNPAGRIKQGHGNLSLNNRESPPGEVFSVQKTVFSSEMKFIRMNYAQRHNVSMHNVSTALEEFSVRIRIHPRPSAAIPSRPREDVSSFENRHLQCVGYP